jgi:hypothetical protein
MVCDDDQELLRLFQLALEPIYDLLQVSFVKECLANILKRKTEGIK